MTLQSGCIAKKVIASHQSFSKLQAFSLTLGCAFDCMSLLIFTALSKADPLSKTPFRFFIPYHWFLNFGAGFLGMELVLLLICKTAEIARVLAAHSFVIHCAFSPALTNEPLKNHEAKP